MSTSEAPCDDSVSSINFGACDNIRRGDIRATCSTFCCLVQSKLVPSCVLGQPLSTYILFVYTIKVYQCQILIQVENLCEASKSQHCTEKGGLPAQLCITSKRGECRASLKWCRACRTYLQPISLASRIMSGKASTLGICISIFM